MKKAIRLYMLVMMIAMLFFGVLSLAHTAQKQTMLEMSDNLKQLRWATLDLYKGFVDYSADSSRQSSSASLTGRALLRQAFDGYAEVMAEVDQLGRKTPEYAEILSTSESMNDLIERATPLLPAWDASATQAMTERIALRSLLSDLASKAGILDHQLQIRYQQRILQGDWTFVAILWAGALLIGVISIFVQLSGWEQERVTRLLAESEDQFRMVLGMSRDIIYRWSYPKHAFDFVNPHPEQILGYDEHEILSMSRSDVEAIIHPEDLPSFIKGFDTLRSNPVITIDMDNRWRHKDGHYIWMSNRIQILRASNGHPLFIVGTLRDITEQIRHEKEQLGLNMRLEEANCNLEESNAMLESEISECKRVETDLAAAREAAESANLAKSRFLANMSHEIRTPMNGIIGMTDLTLMSELTDIQRESLGYVRSSAHSLLRIINDILDYSKIEAGRTQLHIEAFHFREQLTEWLAPFSVNCASKGLGFHTEIDPEIPGILFGDPIRLRQILTNLLGNALKFTHVGGITVRLKREPMIPDGGKGDERELLISCEVEDTGIGIPEEMTGLLFQRFNQLDSTYTKHYQGTGLGLAISRRLIRMMGGDIEVESHVNEGSVFRFTVRLQTSDSPTTRAATGEAPSGADTSFSPLLSGKRALVVEDDDVSRFYMYSLLTRIGMKTVLAENGQSAMKVFKNESFDIVFMDIQLPEMDGMTIARALRELEKGSDRKVAIIAVTAFAEESNRSRFLASGMDDCVAKPVSASTLLDVTERWMLSRKA